LNFISKMEQKLGRFAIPNLIRYVIAAYVIGFGIRHFVPALFPMLILSPAHIMNGEVWRIVSWLLIPPPIVNPIFILIMCYLYFMIGSALEHAWGAFRFNLYFFSGVFFTVVGAFILFFIEGGHALMSIIIAVNVSTYYINMAMFLAFAMTYADLELRLFFVLPIKAKFLGIFYAVILGYEFLTADLWVVRMLMIASLLNFLLFFFFVHRNKNIPFKHKTRQVKMNRDIRRRTMKSVHKCTVCQRTDESNPDLEFRYCSKCNGNFEYCQEHLFTHEHKR